jgi:hypothetical protein
MHQLCLENHEVEERAGSCQKGLASDRTQAVRKKQDLEDELMKA